MFESEPLLRLGSFVLLATTFWIAEWLLPKRGDGPARFPRQAVNMGLAIMNTVALRLGVPLLAMDAARTASDHHVGLLNWLDVPPPVALPLAIVLLDMAIYWQHRFFHWWPTAWYFHRMHHSDTFFDVTTGVRFHPVEIIVSMLLKILLVVFLGVSPMAVLGFEVILNGTSLFNHANLRLPDKLERAMRLILVTPDMHRVHHSTLPQEHNRNFSFSLSLWDRLFGSYQAQPVAGQLGMQIGLDAFRHPRDQTIGRLLMQPFRGNAAR